MKTKIEYTHTSRSPFAIQMMNDAIEMSKNGTGIILSNGKHQCVDALICKIGSTECNSCIYLTNLTVVLLLIF